MKSIQITVNSNFALYLQVMQNPQEILDLQLFCDIYDS